MRAVSASRSREGRQGPFTAGQGLGPETPFFWAPGGRLSLTSGLSITTSPVTGATDAYYTEHDHATVPLWDGRRMKPCELPVRPGTSAREVKISLATVGSGEVRDVFLRSEGRGVRGVVGPAWTSSTARSAVGALGRVRGWRVLAADPSLLYVGTVYGTGAGTCDVSGSRCHLWNAYHRRRRTLVAVQSSTWNYTSATIRSANGSSGETDGTGRVSFVIGLAEDEVRGTNFGYAFNSTAAVQALQGIGLDRTNGNDAQAYVGAALAGGQAANLIGGYAGVVAIGYHYLQAVEASTATGTTTWFGSAATYEQAGLVVSVAA